MGALLVSQRTYSFFFKFCLFLLTHASPFFQVSKGGYVSCYCPPHQVMSSHCRKTSCIQKLGQSLILSISTPRQGAPFDESTSESIHTFPQAFHCSSSPPPLTINRRPPEGAKRREEIYISLSGKSYARRAARDSPMRCIDSLSLCPTRVTDIQASLPHMLSILSPPRPRIIILIHCMYWKGQRKLDLDYLRALTRRTYLAYSLT